MTIPVRKMNLQPILENDLILLRPLKKSDFLQLYEVVRDPMIWKQHPRSNRYIFDEYRILFEESMQSKGTLISIEKSNDQVIGSSRFKLVDHASNAIEIGWSFLARKYWGGTYNRAMKALMIDHAFESVDDVLFYIDKGNIRSQKAVEKIGGKRVTDIKHQHIMHENQDNWTYRINKKDWNNFN